MAERWQISKTHLSADAPNGDTLTVVSYTDGTCGIVRNGTPVQQYCWDPDQMDQCTAVFLLLAHLVR